MDGVEMLLPNMVTCLAGSSSWFSPNFKTKVSFQLIRYQIIALKIAMGLLDNKTNQRCNKQQLYQHHQFWHDVPRTITQSTCIKPWCNLRPSLIENSPCFNLFKYSWSGLPCNKITWQKLSHSCQELQVDDGLVFMGLLPTDWGARWGWQ